MDGALRAQAARLARWNGGSIVVVAGLGTLLTLGADLGTLCGAAIAAAGAVEWRAGGALAAGGDPAALRRPLAGAELAVLAGIVVYSLWRLAGLDVAAELAALPADQLALLKSLLGGVDDALLAELVELALRLTYGTLILASLAYQGAMAWWYWHTLRSTP